MNSPPGRSRKSDATNGLAVARFRENPTGRFVIRLSLALPFALVLGLAGAAAHAEDSATATAPIDAPKAPAKAKKASHNAAAKSGKPQPSAEEADKAARLEEGRKKFFQRSMGFDNGGGSQSPITLQGDGGLTPAMGLKF